MIIRHMIYIRNLISINFFYIFFIKTIAFFYKMFIIASVRRIKNG